MHKQTYLRGRTQRAFADGAARFMADLNAVHCFREGNGRTQLTFLTLLGTRAGHHFKLERMDPAAMLNAMIQSFHADEQVLARLIEALVAR